MQHNGMSPRGIVVASDWAGMSEFRDTDLLPYSKSDLASMGEVTDTKLLVSAAAMISTAIYG